ncbi:C40 family peptidase [Roseivirga pacifica]|uniref:C40 family peptidase n=1 Tax=Roseivirga pacifica TaxID=1267423 RepID=UPI00227CB895|nr:C40 family peptidase [Roseivirga pacifica]
MIETIGYGVIRLPLISVRSEPADAAEMITQLLFGEHYRVLEISDNKKWVRIQNAADNYLGWIDKKQHYEISREYFDQISNTEYRICTDLFSPVFFQKKRLNITFGAVLPLLNNPLFRDEESLAFNGESKSLFQKLDAEALVEFAKKLQFSPYLWGGKSPLGIDCSGLTQLVYKVAGFDLPRDSSQQILEGKEVSFDEAKAGDLAFFTNAEGKMNHVGMVVAPGEIIHASGYVRIDRLDTKGIFNDEQKVYTHTYFKLKRYLKE